MASAAHETKQEDQQHQQPNIQPVQPQLEIGQPNDQYEQKADSMADMVMASSGPEVQTMASDDEDEGSIQMMCNEVQYDVPTMENAFSPEVQTMESDEEESVQMMPELQAVSTATGDSEDEDDDIEKKGDLTGVQMKEDDEEAIQMKQDIAPSIQCKAGTPDIQCSCPSCAGEEKIQMQPEVDPVKTNNTENVNNETEVVQEQVVEEEGEESEEEKKLTLSRGVIQMIAEGNFGGGSTDARKPHFPENVHLFEKLTTEEKDSYKDDRYEGPSDIGTFKKNSTGEWKYVKRLDRHATSSYTGLEADQDSGPIGGHSGVTIGFGFDMGNKFSDSEDDKAEIRKIFVDAGVSETDADLLKEAAGVQGGDAAELTATLRTQIDLTAEQVFNFLKELVPTTDSFGYTRGDGTFHPAIEEAIAYAKYWGNTTIRKGLIAACKDKSFDEQFGAARDYMKEKWEDLSSGDWKLSGYKKMYYYFQLLAEMVDAGYDIEITDVGLTLEELQADNEQTFEFVRDVTERVNWTTKSDPDKAGTFGEGKDYEEQLGGDEMDYLIQEPVGEGDKAKNNTEDVTVIQQLLYNGNYDVEVTGVYDDKTKEAIKKFISEERGKSWTRIDPNGSVLRLLKKYQYTEREEEDTPDIQENPEIQRSENGKSHASPELSTQINSTKGQGQALPKNTQQELGDKMGADFSDVKVHTNSQSAQMNKDLGAKAFTHGSDVYFNEGNYNPNSSDGKHLLAHELTHTIQQGSSGKVQPKIQQKALEKKEIKKLFKSNPPPETLGKHLATKLGDKEYVESVLNYKKLNGNEKKDQLRLDTIIVMLTDVSQRADFKGLDIDYVKSLMSKVSFTEDSEEYGGAAKLINGLIKTRIQGKRKEAGKALFDLLLKPDEFNTAVSELGEDEKSDVLMYMFTNIIESESVEGYELKTLENLLTTAFKEKHGELSGKVESLIAERRRKEELQNRLDTGTVTSDDLSDPQTVGHFSAMSVNALEDYVEDFNVTDENVLTAISQYSFDKQVEELGIVASINGEELTFEQNGADMGININLTDVREWLVGDDEGGETGQKGKYNWSGVIILMKKIANLTHFNYSVPNDLSGNESDNVKIIPNDGIKYIALLQLVHRLTSGSNTYNVDGIPDDDFIKDILDIDVPNGGNAVLELIDQRDTVNEDENEFDIQSFEDFTPGTGDQSMYEDLQDLVEARNGLWSTEDNVTNLVSIRDTATQSAPSGNASYTRGWNDYFFIAWKETDENDDVSYFVTKYQGTTEAGKSASGYMHSDQTLTAYPGFVSQGSGKGDVGMATKNFIRRGTSTNTTSQVDSFQEGYRAGMNFHRGNLVGTHRLLYQYLPTDLKKSSGNVNSEEEFEAYRYLMRILHLLSRNDVNTYSNLSQDEINAMGDDYTELENLFGEFDTNDHLTSSLKTHLKSRNMSEDNQYTANYVGPWSEGCQVPEDSDDFFQMMDDMLKDTADTGQMRWYYTIVDLGTLNVETEEGENE